MKALSIIDMQRGSFKPYSIRFNAMQTIEQIKRVIETGLNNDYQVYICATDSENLVGYCSLTIKNNLWVLANLGNVDELVVGSEYRN